MRPSELADAFKAAIAAEQYADTSATEQYLAMYSPRKLAQLGLAVVNLVTAGMHTALGGKTILELAPDPATSTEINTGAIRVGDIVKVARMKGEADEAVEAVVTKVAATMVALAIDEDAADGALGLHNNTGDTARVWIVKLANTATYNRMVSSMNKLAETEAQVLEPASARIVGLLLGEAATPPPPPPAKSQPPFDTSLNASQQRAVDFAVASPITIVHGPPGTGKTHTLIELIKQLSFHHHERVLVCAPSNIAVDTILERLASAFEPRKRRGSASREQLIRIGHPARLLPANLAHSLDVLSKTSYGGASDAKQVLADLQREIGDTLGSVKKCKRYGERRALWAELKTLRRELRERERKVTRELLVGARVVLSTLHGAGAYELTSLHRDFDGVLFDTIIIDEVSQAMEPQCWIPLVNHLGFKRLVIAGDNMQLPPTVKHQNNTPGLGNLEYTLFDRLVTELGGDAYKKLLDTQYRMNVDIMRFPSAELYGGQLKAHASVANIRLTDHAASSDETDATCMWHDTQGGDYPERAADDAETGSKYNELEALVCVQHLDRLRAAGVDDVGIISPYSAQVSLLKKLLAAKWGADHGVEVSTVDGFQGREKQAIIVSLVRSNDAHDVGFLRDKRRLNVAITRPKRHLCVVGDLELMQQSGVPFLQHWAAFAEGAYEIRYPQLDDY
ncbi:DNA helicase [[Candida] zeylanoides]